jgi:hypothetical protein
VLVNHLGDRVAKKNNVLVKRLNLTLQFDAVNEVNRHWHMFTAQGVKKRVLQELTFVVIAHDILRVSE